MIQFNLKDTEILKRAIEYISNLQFNKYELVIKERKRSLSQNRLYFVVVGIIAKELGYTKEEMHDHFKEHFLGVEYKKSHFGNIYPKLKESKTLTKEDFSRYFDKVKTFAAEQGIIIPTKRDLGY